MNDCIEKSLVGTIGFISSWNLQWVNPLLSFITKFLLVVFNLCFELNKQHKRINKL